MRAMRKPSYDEARRVTEKESSFINNNVLSAARLQINYRYYRYTLFAAAFVATVRRKPTH